MVPRKEIHLHLLYEPVWKVEIKLLTNELRMFISMFQYLKLEQKSQDHLLSLYLVHLRVIKYIITFLDKVKLGILILSCISFHFYVFYKI